VRDSATPEERQNSQKARGRRRAPKLTKARIVTAALALTARDGIAGLTTRKLGRALGVEAMSIYHHFPSKRHLMDALVDHAIGSVAFAASGSPKARLRALCRAYRAMAHRYPKLYPLVALHRFNTAAGVRFIERVLALIQAMEPDPERAARQFRAVGYYLIGATLDETAGYARGPSAAVPVDDAYIAQHCPRLAAAAPYFREKEWNATFEAGLDALFAGMEAIAAKKSRVRRAVRQPRGPTS
jgi:AcrR family transcriptional regulator